MRPNVSAMLKKRWRVSPARSQFREQLEQRLMREFDHQSPMLPKSRSRWIPITRWAIASVGTLLIGLMACRMPSDYTVDMGSRLGITIHRDALGSLDPESIAQYLESATGAELFEIRIQQELAPRRDENDHDSEEVLRIQLDWLGHDREITSDELWKQLLHEFPQLQHGARMEEELFEKQVHGTLVGKMSHDVLDVIIDRHGVEVARVELMQELEEQGLKGEVQIDVEEGYERKSIRVRIEAEAEQ